MDRAIVLAGCVVTLAACATGVSDSGGYDGDGGEITGVGGDGAFIADGGEGGMGGFGGFGGMGGFGGQGGMGGSMGACDFTAVNSCSGAQTIPSVAGDESGPIRTELGDTSKWFQIHITEEVGSIFDADLSYTVTLQSPPGMDYDLYVYEGPQDGNPNCNATPLVGTPQGNAEVVHNAWDDDQPLGGEDDSVWLSIEVRYVAGGLCGPGNEWTLTVQGNT